MPPVDTADADLDRIVRDPIYHQLHQHLMRLIQQGSFACGSQFLTERQVAERFQVSRVTANKALSHMVVSGCLEFRKGVGTFVREKALENDLRSLDSFTAKTEATGLSASTRVFVFRTLTAAKAPPEVAHSLGLKPAEKIFYCERLRLAGGVPVIFEQRYIAAHICPGLKRTDLEGSFYELLQDKFKLKPTEARQRISAVTAEGRQAQLLEVDPGSPTLWVHAVGLAEVAIWVEDTYYRGDHYEFTNQINSGPPGRQSGLALSARSAAPLPLHAHQPK